ncbi:MAG TPA: tetratricopeptide repeat protein [Anaerolineae bacterium]|nr:tetratricopeptide repeat protein [Anaerolineae bacterium]
MDRFLYDVLPYIPTPLIRELTNFEDERGGARTGTIKAAVLFADVSGFTSLTERLAQKGEQGPEELTQLLNEYFSRIIEMMADEGGEVVQFSGDAVLALFVVGSAGLPGAVQRAARAAQQVQSVMATEFALVETSVGPVPLGLKVGIGVGELTSLQVGGVSDRWEYVMAGDPLRQVGLAEKRAERGDIILSPEAEEALAEAEGVRDDGEEDLLTGQNSLPTVEELRLFVPRVVRQWLDQGLRDWLAVLRPMTVLFMGVEGLDYETEGVAEQLHQFLRGAQATIYQYGGSINKLMVDDKGTIFLALLGAPPQAHEDDPLRAVQCATDLLAIAAKSQLTLAVGITTGRVFAGPVGSQQRREYTVMGDAVNLAARLMGVAQKSGGGIRCDFATYRQARQGLQFVSLGAVNLKGKAEAVKLYEPTGERVKQLGGTAVGPLVGRRNEIKQLNKVVTALPTAEKGHVVVIEGEAGIGKSRLMQAMLKRADETKIEPLLGIALSIEQNTPYRAWRELLIAYFGLEERMDLAEKRGRIEAQVRASAARHVARLPLLNDILALEWPESALTQSLDPELRQQNIVILLQALLAVWVRERPLFLVFEDAHWLDALSWDLLAQVTRHLTVTGTPFLLALVVRPLAEHTVGASTVERFQQTTEMTHLNLGNMNGAEIGQLVRQKLGLAEGGLPELVGQLLQERADGNPFFAEELILNLLEAGGIRLTFDAHSRGMVCELSDEWETVQQMLPNTVQGLILARIDRLSPERQLALKVAAVIGRTFSYEQLAHTLRVQAEQIVAQLDTFLADLMEQDLTVLEVPEPDLMYIFKHIITQEVAYETLLYAQRRSLHRAVAEWYEQMYPTVEALTPYYALLAYHYQQAENTEAELRYTQLAGQQAEGQYANETAVMHFKRALELAEMLADDEKQYQILLQREGVYDRIGERDEQKEDVTALLALAKGLGDEALAESWTRFGSYYVEVSEYAEALAALAEALRYAEKVERFDVLGQGHLLWGTTAWLQAEYDSAREHLEKAIALGEAHGLAGMQAEAMMKLGDVCWYQKQTEKAQTYYHQALLMHHDLHDLKSEAGCYSSLAGIAGEQGDYVTAREYAEKALALCQTVGFQKGQAIIQYNLAVDHTDLGDYETAVTYLEKTLAASRLMGSRWLEGMALDTLGLVAYNQGDWEQAIRYAGHAITIQQAIGDKHSETYSWGHLGWTYLRSGDEEKARAAFKRVSELQTELGEEQINVDMLAGVTLLNCGVVPREESLEGVRTILARLEADGVEAAEYALQVYLSCYEVVVMVGSEEGLAEEILKEAEGVLRERAERIRDDGLRQLFLENVPVHRRIRELESD